MGATLSSSQHSARLEFTTVTYHIGTTINQEVFTGPRCRADASARVRVLRALGKKDARVDSRIVR